MKNIEGGISRRNFLMGAAVAGAGAAITGLASCAPQTQGSGKASDSSAGEPASSAPEDEVSQLVTVTDDMVKSEEECDIVVCGSGSAGTYAAVRAAEKGAKVIWLEKNSTLGGASFYTEGTYCANSKLQKEAGVEETEYGHFNQSIQDFQQHGAVNEVIKCVFDNGGPAVDWALEHGARYTWHGSPEGPSVMCFDESGTFMNNGNGVLKPLQEYGATMSNLDVRVSTPAVNIISDNGKVTGVYAQTEDGDIIRINAKAVVLATGGYGNNLPMMKKQFRVPAERVEIASAGISDSTGDGINMALAAGATWHATTSVAYGYTRVRETIWDAMINIALQRPMNQTYKEKPLPVVNQAGERFWNESAWTRDNMVDFNIAVANQVKTWVICDEDVVKRWDSVSEFDHVTGISKGVLRDELQNSDYCHQADTLEDLATQMGVDPATFAESIKQFNAMAQGEVPGDDFGAANPETMNPILTPPFYAAEIKSMAWSTCSGIQTNGNAQAMSAEGTVIEGLYVCGNDNGSCYYNDYPYAVVGGLQQGSAVSQGFAAAEKACESL